ncbi:MAG TPA: porin [Novosphingobium sp.]|nr:porin [Novosphingobium sp.]
MKYTALFMLLLAATGTAAQADGLTADDQGLTLEEGPIELNLGGRVHFDVSTFDEPAAGRTGVADADFRRARLELSGKVGEVFRFRIDREFAGRSKGWRNLWAGITPIDNVELRGGNMMAPFSTEDLQSSNSIPFAERSLASALGPGYGLGGLASASGKRWSAALGWFDDAIANEEGRSSERGRGVVGRLTVLPVSAGKTRLHLGLAGERRSFRPGENLRLSADAGSVLAPNVMATGAITGIEHLNAWNGEAGLAQGPVLIQAQISGMDLERGALPKLRFNGQTLQAAWLVTGGGYDYSRGTGNFSGPDLKRQRLALELAARYSRLDLADGTFDVGTGRAVTAAANAYWGRNLRLMLDYTRTTVRFTGAVPQQTTNTGVARIQLNF